MSQGLVVVFASSWVPGRNVVETDPPHAGSPGLEDLFQCYLARGHAFINKSQGNSDDVTTTLNGRCVLQAGQLLRRELIVEIIMRPKANICGLPCRRSLLPVVDVTGVGLDGHREALVESSRGRYTSAAVKICLNEWISCVVTDCICSAMTQICSAISALSDSSCLFAVSPGQSTDPLITFQPASATPRAAWSADVRVQKPGKIDSNLAASIQRRLCTY